MARCMDPGILQKEGVCAHLPECTLSGQSEVITFTFYRAMDKIGELNIMFTPS